MKNDLNYNNEERYDVPEEQFNVAKWHWEQKNYKQAEFLLRYAAIRRHTAAKNLLKLGIRLRHFPAAGNYLNRFAIEILETLITPKPSEKQIQGMEGCLFKYLHQEYGLKQSE